MLNRVALNPCTKAHTTRTIYKTTGAYGRTWDMPGDPLVEDFEEFELGDLAVAVQLVVPASGAGE